MTKGEKLSCKTPLIHVFKSSSTTKLFCRLAALQKGTFNHWSFFIFLENCDIGANAAHSEAHHLSYSS